MDIHNLACFDYFKKVEDNSINLFVLDLPYTTTNWGKTTACKWDTPIDLEKMWKEIKRIMKKNAVIIFFCNTKFGFNLIQSNQKWFKYDLIWKKSRKVGFLCANRMPLRQHENIYIFKKEGGTYNSQMEEGEPHNRGKYDYGKKFDGSVIYGGGKGFTFKPVVNNGTRHPTSIIEMGEDSENIYVFKKEGGTYNSQMEEGEPYNSVRNHDGKKVWNNVYKQITQGQINTGTRHPTSVLELGEDSENIYVFKKEGGTYNSQMEEGEAYTHHGNYDFDESIYNGGKVFQSHPQNNNGTRHPTSIIEMGEDSENIYVFKKDIVDKERHTYNSQKTELDKPITLSRSTKNYGKVYENKYMKERTNKKTYTDEHPSNILEFNNPTKSIHKTQKPVDLLEWLIKSYSNEGDLICDFTFGSGSTAIACLNTNRRFTGCERDTDIFKTAQQRIEEHNIEDFKKQQEERKKKEIKKKLKAYKQFIEKHTKKK